LVCEIFPAFGFFLFHIITKEALQRVTLCGDCLQGLFPKVADTNTFANYPCAAL
jgi:hypothetical protein